MTPEHIIITVMMMVTNEADCTGCDGEGGDGEDDGSDEDDEDGEDNDMTRMKCANDSS